MLNEFSKPNIVNYFTTVASLCTASRARCVERRKSERTFESGRTNGKPENWRPGQNQAWTKNGLLQSIPLIPNLA